MDKVRKTCNRLSKSGRILIVAALLTSVVLFPGLVNASVGSVTGAVFSACNGTRLADVTVNLDLNGSLVASTATDSEGQYTFTNIPLGDYHVNASKTRCWGNSTVVTVSAGGMAVANLALWMKGDLNTNCLQADAGDLAKMRDASTCCPPFVLDRSYDLNTNGFFADAGDLAKMKDASVGRIELL